MKRLFHSLLFLNSKTSTLYCHIPLSLLLHVSAVGVPNVITSTTCIVSVPKTVYFPHFFCVQHLQLIETLHILQQVATALHPRWLCGMLPVPLVSEPLLHREALHLVVVSSILYGLFMHYEFCFSWFCGMLRSSLQRSLHSTVK